MSAPATRVLVFGASGMIGHTVLRLFHRSPGYEALGTTRSASAAARLPSDIQGRTIVDVDIDNADSIVRVMADWKPDVVINAIGMVKQHSDSTDPLVTLPLNALWPHRLARLCALGGSRLIHISTDCVFDGVDGGYTEVSRPTAADLYGMSKYLGEIHAPTAITLRTSTIGPELGNAHGLLAWFLAQNGQASGYTHAIYSGLSTLEFAKVIRDQVLPRPDLTGLYQVSGAPITKFDLLRLVAEAWGKAIEIVPDERLKIDRSLISAKFHAATGYVAPEWPEMLSEMKIFAEDSH